MDAQLVSNRSVAMKLRLLLPIEVAVDFHVELGGSRHDARLTVDFRVLLVVVRLLRLLLHAPIFDFFLAVNLHDVLGAIRVLVLGLVRGFPRLTVASLAGHLVFS